MPGNRQAFSTAMNAADRFRWDSHWAEAAREYQRALAEFPDDAMARSGLGFCYMQTKQWQQALNEYEYILKQDPSNVIALSKTAELYVILTRRDDAYKAYLHLADLYSQAGQGARAEAAWQKAVQLSPHDPEPHERLAAYYFGKKDISFMIQERLAAAQGYLRRNDLMAARMQCEEVLRIDTTNIQAQQMLSMMRAQGQQPSGPLPPGASTGATFTSVAGTMAGTPSGPLAFTGSPMTERMTSGNISGGNTGIMGNMGNFGGAGNPGPSLTTAGLAGGGADPALHKRVTASQVTGVLRQAQTFQAQGRFNDAIDLCEQILESGFDRPDARYFLGWLYQEQQRWDEAIRQFQTLLNDPDYALSCYYALGQCYRARGDLRTATMHFDEAVDRVNLDALTVEESDQLVQLCQEAAEAHRALGEQEQALTVYNALLGFLRSRGWNDKVAQVEFMTQQLMNGSPPAQPVTPPPQQQPLQDAATMTFSAGNMPHNAPPPASAQLPASPQVSIPGVTNNNAGGELPDWLTGILSDADKTQVINKPAANLAPAPQQPPIDEQPTTEQRIASGPTGESISSMETRVVNPADQDSSSWLTGDAKPGNATRIIPPEDSQLPAMQSSQEIAAPTWTDPADQTPPSVPVLPVISQQLEQVSPVLQTPPAREGNGAVDLLTQMAGASNKDEALKQVAEAVLASTASLPEHIRLQVVQSMQDIQSYINHGLLTPATEECLHVIDIAPQYLDVHQVLCEIYVRQGKVEQAITKYAILVDTYVVNGRLDDAIATYRRILQLEPNNLTYRMRLINLLSSQGNKEDLLRERTLAAESYLRLGFMDRALTELEQALQESPTSVPTRLNYALALQKLGRCQQAVTEYQRVLEVDPSKVTALVRGRAAHCLQAEEKPEAAIQQLEQALQSVRRSSSVPFDPGVWAARPREEGEEHQAPEVEISMLLAKAYGRTGRQDQMEATLRKVKRTTTHQDEVYSTLAEISARQGSVDSALQEYADLVRHYRSSRQVDNAITVLNEMVRLEPQDARAHVELGDIYVGRGLLDEGIAELRILADIYLRRNQK